MSIERFTFDNIDWPEFLFHGQRYAFAAQLCRDAVVLDCPTGEGYGAQYLSRFASQVTGVDISNDTIIRCREKYANSDKVTFKIADMSALPFADQSFDVVNCFEGIEHVSRDKQLKSFDEMKRVLKPGGILCISTPDRIIGEQRGYSNPYHIAEMSLTEFTRDLKAHFKNVRIYSQELNMVSGLWDLDCTNTQMFEASKIAQVAMHAGQMVDMPGHNGFYYMMAVCSDRDIDLPSAHYFSSYNREPALALWNEVDASRRNIDNLSELQTRYAALEREQNDLQTAKLDADNALLAAQAQILNLNTEIDQRTSLLTAELTGLQAEILNLNAEADRRTSALTAEVTDLQAENAQLTAAALAFEEEAEAQRSQILTLQGQVADSRRNYSDELSSYEQKLEIANKEIVELKARLTLQNVELATHTRLVQELRISEANNIIMAKSLRDIESRQLRIDGELADLMGRLSELSDELDSKNQYMDAARLDLDSKNQEIESKNQEIESKNRDLDSKNQEIESKNRDLDFKNQEIESRDRHIEIRNAELDQLRSTVSLLSEKVGVTEQLYYSRMGRIARKYYRIHDSKFLGTFIRPVRKIVFSIGKGGQ